jgi:hypothetical protein
MRIVEQEAGYDCFILKLDVAITITTTIVID